MKRKEFQQLKSKKAPELHKDLETYRDQLWVLKRDLAAGKVKNVQEIAKLKTTIAQILTILSWNTQ